MNIDEMGVTELKALVYDEMFKIENAQKNIIQPAQQNIAFLNSKIGELLRKEQELLNATPLTSGFNNVEESKDAEEAKLTPID